MKVLHVNHLLDPVSGGGTAERTFQLTRSLLQESTESAILTLNIGDIQTYEKRLSTVIIYKLPCLNRRFFIFGAWPRDVYRLIAKYDVIHLMGHWTILNALVALMCMIQRKPYVICPAGALKVFGRSKWLKWIYDFVIGKRIIHRASAWVAITEEEKTDFVNYGIAAESVLVIPNGVDPDDYVLSDNISKSSASDVQYESMGSPYILFLGRLNEIKGPDLLLEGFVSVSGKYPDLHLIFAGPDSGLMTSLKATVEKKGLEKKVHFIGFVSGNEKINLLRNAFCLVIPSREEAMSIVVLEAGICGTPVIFTDQCGLEDFAQVGAGLQVKPTSEAISRGLLEALAFPEKLKKSGEKLRNQVYRNFLWNTQAKRYLSLYSRLI